MRSDRANRKRGGAIGAHMGAAVEPALPAAEKATFLEGAAR